MMFQCFIYQFSLLKCSTIQCVHKTPSGLYMLEATGKSVSKAGRQEKKVESWNDSQRCKISKHKTESCLEEISNYYIVGTFHMKAMCSCYSDADKMVKLSIPGKISAASH